MSKQTIFTFGNYAPEIYADEKGKFWRKDNDRFVDTKYYNGRMCVPINGKVYGVKKLRTFANKEMKEISECPFEIKTL